MSERCVPMIEVEGEPCEEHGWPMAGIAYGGLCIEGRLIKAEAQIQRVREVCDLWQRRHDSSIRHPTAIPAVAITAVLRALDGDGDE